MTRVISDLDVSILKEMTGPGMFQSNFRESYSAIGRRMGVDAETVRVALNRAKKKGMIQKWRLFLNPELIDQKIGTMQLEVGDVEMKSQIVSRIQLLDGVVHIIDFHGPSLRIIFYFEDESSLRRKLDLIKSISGNHGEIRYWISHLPPVGMKLGNLDWKILKQIMHDPKRDAAEVADEIGVSKRTVNRRLKRMNGSNIAFLAPVRDIKKWRGTVCSFLVFATERGRTGIQDLLRTRTIKVEFALDLSKEASILTLAVGNPSEANEFLTELKNIGGVRQVKMGLVNDYVWVDDWLDRLVARQAGKLPLADRG